MWYDKAFGGRKAWKEVLASLFGLLGFFMVPSAARADHFYLILAFWLGCFGIYSYFNVQEKKIQIGNNNGEKK